MSQYTNNSDLENDPSVKYGKYLANPPLEEEIVISGMSGIFPLASDIEEFKNNLYNKVDMVTHFEQSHPELPCGLGKFKDKAKFDAGFFGVHKQHSIPMSQLEKGLLEKCVECIFDAGLHPSDLSGTKTGVFIAICFNEAEFYWYQHTDFKNAAIMGNLKAVMANKLSHFLKLDGPSFNTDTACSSSMFALDSAYKALRMGQIENAIICGAQNILDTGITLLFARLGVLSKEGVMRVFDEDGQGYVRAEAVSAILLQKAKNSKRIYAKLVHMKVNCDGFKEQGITYPSGETQLNLLKEIYLESGVNPKDISFVEAHGTGTPIGDPEEMNCIDDFFAKERVEPLLVGSVKSSIGHTEPSAGVCSITKAILVFETNLISPNINFKTPRKNIPGLLEGRIKLVVENTPFQDINGLIGVNCFGFGGSNAHVILKWNTKEKTSSGKPSDNLPRIICVSGRTEEAVTCLLNDVAEKFDAEHIGLIHNCFRKSIINHPFRGYTIVSKQGVLKQSVKQFNPSKSDLHIYFGNVSSNFGNLHQVQELLKLTIMANFQNRIEKFLESKGIKLDTLTSTSATSDLNQLLARLITQLSLAELLKQLEVKYKRVSAYSFGEFSLAYFQHFIDLEDILECVYVFGKVADKIRLTKHKDEISIAALSRHKNQILTKCQKISKNSKKIVDAIFKDNEKNTNNIPKNANILEIGQNLVNARTRCSTVVSFNVKGGIQGVLEVIGNLFEIGAQPQVQKLYPEVQFPVSRGTPMISPKIKWKHDLVYFIPTNDFGGLLNETTFVLINIINKDWEPLTGHVIDGRNLFPASGYLYVVWFVISEVQRIIQNKCKVMFENCKFKRACTLSKNSLLCLSVMIQRATGNFEICEENVPLVTGRVKVVEDVAATNLPMQPEKTESNLFLNSKDIYKVLRLQGYHYRRLFRSMTQCNTKATSGKIRWAGNWIAFMDNMLQIKILGEDTNLLYVPTSIARITIDPNKHLEEIESIELHDKSKDVEIPVRYNKDCDIIQSGGIEIRRLLASAIPRKKYAGLPVLEKYQFVPNETKLLLEQSVRVFMQVALENNCGFKIKVTELIDESSRDNVEPLGPIIQNVLEDQPLVQTDITVLASKNMELSVKVENKKLAGELENTIVVGSELLARNTVFEEAFGAVIDSGYIISRESLNTITSKTIPSNVILLNISKTEYETLLFMKKQSNKPEKQRAYVNVNTTNKEFDWLDKLKDAVGKDYDVIVWCQNEPLSGIIGLVNCIRREPGTQNVRSLFIVDDAPEFDPTHSFYKSQLEKNMAVNVYMNGQWGTYRHLLLDELQEVENEHCYSNSLVRGDLSSIRWIEGPLTRNMQLEQDESLVEVYYSSLNFRDVMTASGRITLDIRDRRDQECVQGLEFSGITTGGKRVMGIVPQGALATLVRATNSLLWDVPTNWSLKEAATVPVVYGTCLYALVSVGKIKPSESVLIHSGTGGIGQAAINLCLNMGCTVFTTVGTDEKREFIKKHFPQINERHIGNSRDISFEQMVIKETQGRGVDIVLNSLAEDKLFASVRCLAAQGRFLEIGKFDLLSDNQLSLLAFKDGAAYHGVMLDRVFNESSHAQKQLKVLIQKYMDSGAIKPLLANVFEKHEVEQAYRYMTAGKHMGKVLIEIRKENEENSQKMSKYKGLPRYYCNPKKSYIICGGLGGFGLELADWLVLRGAKNLILTSRKGITTGYQNKKIIYPERRQPFPDMFLRIRKNLQGYGACMRLRPKLYNKENQETDDVNVLASEKTEASNSCRNVEKQDITCKSGCENLIGEAQELAPVDAIFNLAVVLEDAILNNQTKTSFETSFRPKAYATKYLDEVSRILCPDLRTFVIFSSVSCGRGNAGQSNYGMSNSVMERICEKRRREGYPALAIEWGAVGDVGLVAEMLEEHVEIVIGGTLPQRISNCLQVMDVFLRQEEATIVSSIVVAEKKMFSNSGKIEEVVCSILGIRDIKSVSMHSTLAEIGMDSMNAVEVKQTLEREYNIFLTPAEIRTVTLAKIKALQEESCNEVASLPEPKDEFISFSNLHKNLHKFVNADIVGKLKTKNTKKNNENLPTVIALPGIEGVCDVLEKLTENLEIDVYGIKYCPFIHKNNFSEMAELLLPYIKDILQSQKSFYLIAHSMGAILALELVSKMEKLGYLVTIILLDGSPWIINQMLKEALGEDTSESSIENIFIESIMKLQPDKIETEKIMEKVYICSTLQEKLSLCASILKYEGSNMDLILALVSANIMRIKACANYIPSFDKLKSKVSLYKSSTQVINTESKDYGLGQYFEQPVEVKVFGGTHSSMLENKELAKAIMENILGVAGFSDA